MGLYASDLTDWRIGMFIGMGTGRTVVLKRPSWLHPFRRVLWVHHHGPYTPEVRRRIPSRRGMGVLKGVTG